VHIALKVDNLERTTQFYEKVFGFKESKTEKVRDHNLAPSLRRRDRPLDHAVRRRDRIRRVEGRGRRPLHPSLRRGSGQLKEAEKEVKAFGCKIISDPGVVPVKFRAPGGTVCEIVPKGRYKKSAKK